MKNNTNFEMLNQTENDIKETKKLKEENAKLKREVELLGDELNDIYNSIKEDL